MGQDRRQTVDEAFTRYTNTSTVNLLLSWSDVLAERGWPFPAYLDLDREVAGLQLKRPQSTAGVLLRIVLGRPIFSHATLWAALADHLAGDQQLFSIVMMTYFWRHNRSIFAGWRQAPFLRSREPVITDIQRTYRRGYWAACIPTALILFDHVIRDYFGTASLR
ncbi:MAG: hypothetical protein ACREA0_29220, partial [bacterium]